jgi:hypothetical protein
VTQAFRRTHALFVRALRYASSAAAVSCSAIARGMDGAILISPPAKWRDGSAHTRDHCLLSCRQRLRANITQTSCFLRSCNPEIPNQFFRHSTNPHLCREELVMDRLLNDVAREYYRRAFVARDCAERSGCPETRSYLLALEKLWIAQARRHDPPNCSARG